MLPSLGAPELIIIGVIAIIIFGPAKLPDLGRSLGRGFREFRQAKDEITGITESVKSDVNAVKADMNAVKADMNVSLDPTKDVAKKNA